MNLKNILRVKGVLIGTALMFLTCGNAFALNADEMKILKAKKVRAVQVSKQKTVAILLSAKKADIKAAMNETQSSKSKRITVVVDGILMEMPEWVVKAMIRSGVFKVVWAGTRIPKIDDFNPEWW